MEYAYQNSTIAQILEAIINESTFEGESNSNIGDILLSILNKTPYTEPPKSVIADLFLRVKAKIEGESFEPYEGDHISRIADILISILNETEYTEEPQSRIAELLLELKEELEAYTELTASGSVASFITNVVKPLVNGEFTIQAYQEGSGDPSPVNVRNIIPFNAQKIIKAGKNLLDKSLLKLSTTSTQPFLGKWGVDSFPTNIPNGSIFLPAGQYTLSRKNKSGESLSNTQMSIYDENGNNLYTRYTIKSITFTVTKSMAVCVYINCGAAGFTSWDDYDIQLEVGSQVTDYEPYNGEIKTVDLEEDVYGGSYNSVSGKLSKTWNCIRADSVYYRYSNGVFYSTDPQGEYTKKRGVTNIICSHYKTENQANLACFGNSSNRTWYIKDASFNGDVTAFKQFLTDNNVMVSYELETPIETDIGATPIETYDGVNNIFCDTGKSSVTYLYKGTPPETLTRSLSKGSSENNDIMKEDIETEDEIEKPINEEVNENEK